MKIIADENIPVGSVERLRELGHDVLSISTESPGIDDDEVLRLANQTARLLITFDKDFGTIVFRDRQLPLAGIVLFRITIAAPLVLAERIAAILERRDDWGSYFSVVDETNIRMIPL
jgi:predicted nuclease of predicted toxin-antitoxin system